MHTYTHTRTCFAFLKVVLLSISSNILKSSSSSFELSDFRVVSSESISVDTGFKGQPNRHILRIESTHTWFKTKLESKLYCQETHKATSLVPGKPLTNFAASVIAKNFP